MPLAAACHDDRIPSSCLRLLAGSTRDSKYESCSIRKVGR